MSFVRFWGGVSRFVVSRRSIIPLLKLINENKLSFNNVILKWTGVELFCQPSPVTERLEYFRFRHSLSQAFVEHFMSNAQTFLFLSVNIRLSGRVECLEDVSLIFTGAR